jgi:hypothetical protein
VLCVQCGCDLRTGKPAAAVRTRAQRARDIAVLAGGFVVVLGGIAGVALLVRPPGSGATTRPAQVAEAREPGPDGDWLQRFFMGTEYPARDDGGLTFGTVDADESGDSPKLPFAISQQALARTAAIVEVDGGKLARGWVYGRRAELKAPLLKPGIKEFKLPKGLRLVQVRYRPKAMRTLAGQVFNYVGQINQYFAVDSQGDRHPLAGYYGLVRRGSDDYLELFFNGDPDSPINPGYACMLDFKMIDRRELNNPSSSVVYLLFLVPAGTEITRVENQAGDGRDVSLRARGE